MPYLRVTCPHLDTENYFSIANLLTEAVNEIFHNPKSRTTKEELRERTTVHFIPYKEGEFFIGGRTPHQRKQEDITAEISDWYMSVKMQRKVAKHLTSVLAQAFNISHRALDNINIRFHSYPPTDFAVGGKLLSDIIPYVGRMAKRLFA